ncbi:hypothetical protein Glove_212g24 [Diversispora epigaea]|uniref:Protein kinase domain-containing protein n=1 Tax=Diversispora epigaea TaxID=1348612 RepID=A0A397IHX6_9GLOM|nr:hypothetical protein Glove_212g24 [Diversispora epigaea]
MNAIKNVTIIGANRATQRVSKMDLTSGQVEMKQWIPYDRFQDIETNSNRFIEYWDIENQQWKRSDGNSILLRISDVVASVVFYGITKDPETYEYMIVLEYLEGKTSKIPKRIPFLGIILYIAPEVLTRGEYTKAADVYSLAFVAYELITGILLYDDVSNNKDLAFKICNGFRPKITFYTPKLITQIIMRCWDARITKLVSFYKFYENTNILIEEL